VPTWRARLQEYFRETEEEGQARLDRWANRHLWIVGIWMAVTLIGIAIAVIAAFVQR
jgi:hypothetical protein